MCQTQFISNATQLVRGDKSTTRKGSRWNSIAILCVAMWASYECFKKGPGPRDRKLYEEELCDGAHVSLNYMQVWANYYTWLWYMTKQNENKVNVKSPGALLQKEKYCIQPEHSFLYKSQVVSPFLYKYTLP